MYFYLFMPLLSFSTFPSFLFSLSLSLSMPPLSSKQVGMEALRARSVRLTGYLEQLITSELSGVIRIFSPSEPSRRGCQLSLSFFALDRLPGLDMDSIVQQLAQRGVVCDARKPNVMRVAPTPLYNTFEDIFLFVSALKEVLGLTANRR